MALSITPGPCQRLHPGVRAQTPPWAPGFVTVAGIHPAGLGSVVWCQLKEAWDQHGSETGSVHTRCSLCFGGTRRQGSPAFWKRQSYWERADVEM